MEILGVMHDDTHPDFKTTINYLDAHLTKSSIVALEGADLTVSDLLHSPRKYPNDPFFAFFSKIAVHTHNYGARAIVVDDPVARQEESELEQFLCQYEGLTAEQWNAKYTAAVKRSIAMYQQAKQHRATHLIIGGMHAYDIKRIFSVPVTHFTPREFDSRDQIETRSKAISKFQREYASGSKV